RPRVSVPCSFDRQGGFLVRPCGLPRVSVSLLLLCLLLTSPMGSGSIALPSAIADGPWETSRGKTQSLRCVGAGFIKHTPARMEDFAITCPLVPGVPHLLSGSCSSPRIFGLGFLQTPPRGDALALLLAFGCANTWREDLHLASSVPCPAHTTTLTCRGGVG